MNEWHVIAGISQLTPNIPFSTKLLGEDIVVWQSDDGEIQVWRDLCVHRGTRLSLGKVRDNCLVCPYHGWTYDQTGQCVHIPAHPHQAPPRKAKAQTYPVQLKYGLIWTTLGDPTDDIPTFPEWEDDAFRNIPSGPYNFAAFGTRAIENYLDVTHFPFVHAGTLGDPTHPQVNDYEAKITPNGVVAENIQVWQPDPDGTGEGGYVTYTYKVFRPLVAYFVKTKGPTFAAYYAVSPVDELHSRGWILMAMNYGFDIAAAELIHFQDVVTGEDIPIVESQRPELLPLDLSSELHLKSDRTAIAYRTWLRQLGVKYGTA